MPTIKQLRAVSKLVENGGNISKAMESANYSKNTAKTPQKLTESKGFKEICDEVGLTDDFILQCLVDDIADKPRNRATELQLGAKIKGMLSDKLDITSKGLAITFDNAFKPKDEAQNSSLSDKTKKDD